VVDDLNERLTEPRRYSTIYDLVVADIRGELQGISAEIGEFRGLKETFRNDEIIVDWCDYYITLAVADMEKKANEIREYKAKADEFRRIEDVFRRGQGDLIRGDGSEFEVFTGSPGECEVADPRS